MLGIEILITFSSLKIIQNLLSRFEFLVVLEHGELLALERVDINSSFLGNSELQLLHEG